MSTGADHYQFQISLSVLNHLGRNLYRSFITVLAEAVSNSWDAGAENVWINIDKSSSTFWIVDDGAGMTPDDFQNKFLKIGYSKRKSLGQKSETGRPFIGAKGIGKLALLSCAQRITVLSKTHDTQVTGGTIDNAGLDKAITNDLIPEDYPLEAPNLELLKLAAIPNNNGTAIFFENTKEQIRNSEQQIRKLIALSFRFFLFDSKFSIYVNGTKASVEDLADLCNATQFLWGINGFEDDFTRRLNALKEPKQALTSKLGVTGFFATVMKPRDLKITGTEERATVDLFVNGRLRERNVLRHIPTQRIVESYLYGQLHFDEMDGGAGDPFTSSREGVIEDDVHFQALLDLLKRDFLPKIIDKWDELRLKHREGGDEENSRKSKKARKVAEAYAAASEEFDTGKKASNDTVDRWISDLAPDAEFNITSYVDCFIAENLVRQYLRETKTPLSPVAENLAKEWKEIEEKRKKDANLSFDIRKDDTDLSYLSMDELSISAEGGKNDKEGKPTPLFSDAVSYKPVRNVVGHTGLLTDPAKQYLGLRLENIKARLRKLLAAIA